jgi:hypothetical protein
MSALARANSIQKRQARPLVREVTPQKQGRNCQTVINIWSRAPDGVRHQNLLIDHRQSQCNFDFNFDFDLTQQLFLLLLRFL